MADGDPTRLRFAATDHGEELARAELYGLLARLWLAPPGVLGKMDAIGYAVCHRIASHSFYLDGRQLPLCARCSGMYLGALLGLVVLLPRSRKTGFPPLRIQLVLGLFLAAFAVDGVNSFLDLISGSPVLYVPQNALRLLTGSMVGVGAAALLVSVVGQSAWQTLDTQPALKSFGLLGLLVALALLVDLAILSDNTLLLYPLAILSGLTVLFFLGLAYSVLWISLLKKWNSFDRWGELWPVVGLGLCTALAQVLATDLIRFSLTGTWGGLI